MPIRRQAPPPAKRASGPHKVVNRRKIPTPLPAHDVVMEDGKVVHIPERHIPIVTIHDVHYYTNDIITVIDDSAQMLIDRGFLVPVGSKTEVSNVG